MTVPLLLCGKMMSLNARTLSELHPRYTCFLARPEEAGKKFRCGSPSIDQKIRRDPMQIFCGAS